MRRVLLCGNSLLISGLQASLRAVPELELQWVDAQPGAHPGANHCLAAGGFDPRSRTAKKRFFLIAAGGLSLVETDRARN